MVKNTEKCNDTLFRLYQNLTLFPAPWTWALRIWDRVPFSATFDLMLSDHLFPSPLGNNTRPLDPETENLVTTQEDRNYSGSEGLCNYPKAIQLPPHSNGSPGGLTSQTRLVQWTWLHFSFLTSCLHAGPLSADVEATFSGAQAAGTSWPQPHLCLRGAAQNILLAFQIHSPSLCSLLCALGSSSMDLISGFLDPRLWWKTGRRRRRVSGFYSLALCSQVTVTLSKGRSAC